MKKFNAKSFIPDYLKMSMNQSERAEQATEKMQLVFGALAKNGNR